MSHVVEDSRGRNCLALASGHWTLIFVTVTVATENIELFVSQIFIDCWFNIQQTMTGKNGTYCNLQMVKFVSLDLRIISDFVIMSVHVTIVHHNDNVVHNNQSVDIEELILGNRTVLQIRWIHPCCWDVSAL